MDLNMSESSLPVSLFRYHSQNVERLVGMIRTGRFTIRLAHPREFNDLNDTVIPINIDPHKKMVRDYTRMLESAYCYMYKAQEEAKRDGTEIDNQELLLFAVQEAYYGYPLRFERCRMNKESAASLRKKLRSQVDHYFKEQHARLSRALAANLGICCFSTDIQSPTMWGYYAKNTGYALEYDMASVVEIGKKGYGIHPITYQPDTTDRTAEIIKISVSCLTSFMGCFDEFEEIIDNIAVSEDGKITWDVLEDSAKIFRSATDDFVKEVQEDQRTLALVIKHSLRKAKNWEYEKEWRLLMMLNADAKEEERHIPLYPKAIYLGALMPEDEVAQILQALHETNSAIKVYQIQPNIMKQGLDIHELC